MRRLSILPFVLVGILTFASATVALAVEAPTSKPVVSVDWLKKNLSNPDLFVLDIRSQLAGASRETFEEGHIPGAIYSNYLRDGWRVTDANGTPGVLPPADHLENLFRSLGITNDNHVVIIGAGKRALDISSATRVYWTLKMAGHKSLSILDGGYSAWASATGNPIETGPSTPTPSGYAVSMRSDLLVTKSQVIEALGSKTALVDNRPPAQYTGKKSHPAAKRAGTIPGALNIPESTLTQNGQGFFQSKQTLNALHSVASTSQGGTQINFCNTGHWASLGWFVSHEILGNKNARLYDGSIVEWSADPTTPMVKKAVN